MTVSCKVYPPVIWAGEGSVDPSIPLFAGYRPDVAATAFPVGAGSAHSSTRILHSTPVVLNLFYMGRVFFLVVLRISGKRYLLDTPVLTNLQT